MWWDRLRINGPYLLQIFLHYCIGRVLILLEFFNFFFRIHILKLKKYLGILWCSLGPGKKKCFYILAKTDKAGSYTEMTTFYQFIYFLELSMFWDDPILTPNYQNEKEVQETT